MMNLVLLIISLISLQRNLEFHLLQQMPISFSISTGYNPKMPYYVEVAEEASHSSLFNLYNMLTFIPVWIYSMLFLAQSLLLKWNVFMMKSLSC